MAAFKQHCVAQMILLVFFGAICVINCQHIPDSTDTQDEQIDEPPHIDYRQFLNALQSNGPSRNYRGYDDPVEYPFTNPIKSYHMQRMLRSPLPAYPSTQQQSVGYQSANMMDKSIGSSPGVQRFYAVYRLPEMKRQARYRQCYFNPISCFK